MKKQYIHPTTEQANVCLHTTILTGSAPSSPIGFGPGGADDGTNL